MFENLLYQNASSLIAEDINKNALPHSILLSGPVGSGKLTCALEIARVLSCHGLKKGGWNCDCPSCLKHKALNSQDVIIAGPKDSSPEIAASVATFLSAVSQNAAYVNGARYLFIRSVRKLLLRFSPVLLEDDPNVGKISANVAAIDELLEEIEPGRELPEYEKLEKKVGSVVTQCEKLESSFMYDSIPVNQIRHASSWARLTAPGTKKVLIIENAERMQESVRNALLKILEEPPEDTVFILTTANRGAVMPTILSRVRTYTFAERNSVQQQEVLSRVFHAPNAADFPDINFYLSGFLPVPVAEIKSAAINFCNLLFQKKSVNLEQFVKDMNNFEPRVLLKIFFAECMQCFRIELRKNCDPKTLALKTKFLSNVQLSIKQVYDSITIFNQSPASAFEAFYERIF